MLSISAKKLHYGFLLSTYNRTILVDRVTSQIRRAVAQKPRITSPKDTGN